MLICRVRRGVILFSTHPEHDEGKMKNVYEKQTGSMTNPDP